MSTTVTLLAGTVVLTLVIFHLAPSSGQIHATHFLDHCLQICVTIFGQEGGVSDSETEILNSIRKRDIQVRMGSFSHKLTHSWISWNQWSWTWVQFDLHTVCVCSVSLHWGSMTESWVWTLNTTSGKLAELFSSDCLNCFPRSAFCFTPHVSPSLSFPFSFCPAGVFFFFSSPSLPFLSPCLKPLLTNYSVLMSSPCD